jgi:hypothetical protein
MESPHLFTPWIFILRSVGCWRLLARTRWFTFGGSRTKKQARGVLLSSALSLVIKMV